MSLLNLDPNLSIPFYLIRLEKNLPPPSSPMYCPILNLEYFNVLINMLDSILFILINIYFIKKL